MTGGMYIPVPRTPGQNGRWVARDKEEIVRLITLRKLTPEEAMSRYAITEEELESWVIRYKRHGRVGLAATKIQERPV